MTIAELLIGIMIMISISAISNLAITILLLIERRIERKERKKKGEGFENIYIRR